MLKYSRENLVKTSVLREIIEHHLCTRCASGGRRNSPRRRRDTERKVEGQRTNSPQRSRRSAERHAEDLDCFEKDRRSLRASSAILCALRGSIPFPLRVSAVQFRRQRVGPPNLGLACPRLGNYLLTCQRSTAATAQVQSILLGWKPTCQPATQDHLRRRCGRELRVPPVIVSCSVQMSIYVLGRAVSRFEVSRRLAAAAAGCHWLRQCSDRYSACTRTRTGHQRTLDFSADPAGQIYWKLKIVGSTGTASGTRRPYRFPMRILTAN